MAINIQTQKTYIPIQLGDLELRFDVSDDSLVKLRSNITKVEENFNKLTEDNEAGIEQVKNILKEVYDNLFGDGTFEQVYEISPSVLIVTEYFLQIANAIRKELNKRGFQTSPHEKAQKYLANKK